MGILWKCSFCRVLGELPEKNFHTRKWGNISVFYTVSFYQGYIWVTLNFSKKKYYLRISVGFGIGRISGCGMGGWSGPAVVRFVVDGLSIMNQNWMMNFLFEKECNNKRLTVIKFSATSVLKFLWFHKESLFIPMSVEQSQLLLILIDLFIQIN